MRLCGRERVEGVYRHLVLARARALSLSISLSIFLHLSNSYKHTFHPPFLPDPSSFPFLSPSPFPFPSLPVSLPLPLPLSRPLSHSPSPSPSQGHPRRGGTRQHETSGAVREHARDTRKAPAGATQKRGSNDFGNPACIFTAIVPGSSLADEGEIHI